MTKRTPTRQAIRLAIRTTLFVAIAGSTATASVSARAAEAGGSSPPGDSFMPIHMDNQKIGSAVTTYWKAQTSVGAMTAAAKPKPLWERKTDSAYFTVFAHYCAPGMLDRAAGAVEPHGIEVAIYTDRLRVEYEGDCRAFYLNEVAVRVDPQARRQG